MMRRIPFYLPLMGSGEIAAVRRAISENHLSGNGPVCKELEGRLKKYTGSRFAFFVTSCTSAVEMGLAALGVSKGDEVICPSFSFVSIANAVVKTGARLVFVDVNGQTLNMDPELIENALTKKTKAVIAVHYAGSSCPMDGIIAVAKKSRAKVIEDAAQCFGSLYKGRHLGTIGDIGCLSLHGTKNITCGEGGVFLTNNGDIARRADIIREKGTNRSLFLKGKIDKYRWISTGSSYVQSDILASIAIEQLKKTDLITKRRSAIARYYDSRFSRLAPLARLPKAVDGATSNRHIYALLLSGRKRRDRFIERMRSRGIECLSHFVPLHISPFAVKHLGYRRGDYPVTESVCDSLVRIPIYPQLKACDTRRIADAVEETIGEIG